MMPLAVIGFYADQGEPQAYGKSKQFTAKPSKLHYLTAYNKGASTVYLELYDSASGASGEPRVLPLASKQLVYWSQMRMRAGIFVQAVDADTGGSLIADDDVKFDCGFTDEIV
jgi:hypothetical protein